MLGWLVFGACGGPQTSGGPLDSRIVRGDPERAPPSRHPDVFRIADWNIKAARDSSIAAIGTKLAVLDPDVITLQEVDVNTHRTGEIDEPAVLGAMLGYQYAFAPTIPWDGGIYGIAMLSRYPLGSLARLRLTNLGANEARTALEATVCMGKVCLRVVDHHADDAPLAAQLNVSEVLKGIHTEIGQGLTLLGDLNQVPSDPGPQACVAAGLVDIGARFGAAPTFGSERIDYAFADSALAPCAQGIQIEQGTESDHDLVVVDFGVACLAARR